MAKSRARERLLTSGEWAQNPSRRRRRRRTNHERNSSQKGKIETTD